MQRVINNADQVVADMLVGFAAANGDMLTIEDNGRVAVSTESTDGRVGVVSGGGSGHEPAFIGYVGPGMLDAVAIGEIFTSPSARSFLAAFRAADSGHGVACLYGNYAGDNMNVRMAVRQAEAEGIRVGFVVANDDALSAPATSPELRRGVAGEILMWKAAAARAREGASLEEVLAAGQAAIDATRSVGVGLTSCVIPAVGHPNFTVDDGTMEIGIGHHGEPGTSVVPLGTAREIATLMLDATIPELSLTRGDAVAVLVSGLGATPIMESYILYGEIASHLDHLGLQVSTVYVGNLFTSLEMMGVTLTITRLDADLQRLLAAPARCAAFHELGR